MLFNSYEFMFAFLPIALLLYYGLKRYRRHEFALAALVLASLAFYSYWNRSIFPCWGLRRCSTTSPGDSSPSPRRGPESASSWLWEWPPIWR